MVHHFRSAIAVTLASKKFLKILSIPQHQNKEQPHAKEDAAEKMHEQEKKSTFFFMGMDVPIEMTHALKKLDERSLKNPFMHDFYEIKS